MQFYVSPKDGGSAEQPPSGAVRSWNLSGQFPKWQLRIGKGKLSARPRCFQNKWKLEYFFFFFSLKYATTVFAFGIQREIMNSRDRYRYVLDQGCQTHWDSGVTYNLIRCQVCRTSTIIKELPVNIYPNISPCFYPRFPCKLVQVY